ncbi:MAG: sugar phosphate isomerase/epimerase [Lentisphaeria bacterium]|nr:sugar phosphate isomerase/epimerase [Lentisphaeria bacterium]
MKIGALNSSLRKPLPATVKKYAEMGIQGMQIQITPEHLIFSDDRLRDIRRTCEDAGLEISAVCGDIAHTHFGVTAEWPDRVELHKRVVDIAVKLGTKVITTHIGVVPADKKDPVYPIMVESIGSAAEYSGSCGAVFAIETGPEKADVLLQLLQDVNSKGLGVNLDPANLRMVSCEDPIRAVELLGKYIVHTHAKDGINLYPGLAAAAYRMLEPDGSPRVFSERAAEYKEVPLGQGQVPWDGYLAALKKAGYNGFLTIERECGNDREGDIRQAVEFLKSKLAK